MARLPLALVAVRPVARLARVGAVTYFSRMLCSREGEMALPENISDGQRERGTLVLYELGLRQSGTATKKVLSHTQVKNQDFFPKYTEQDTKAGAIRPTGIIPQIT